MTWQPIESAPKVEGHHVLLFGSGSNFSRCCFVGCWWSEQGQEPHWRMMSKRDHCNPTHWQPLPDPPVQP